MKSNKKVILINQSKLLFLIARLFKGSLKSLNLHLNKIKILALAVVLKILMLS